jgi:peptide/nickel transport system substrate-binding protein
MKIKGGIAARRFGMALLAAGLTLSAQVLVSAGATAGAASSGKYGVLTDGYDLASGINPTEFDPTQFTTSACCFGYDWPIYAGLLRQTTSGSLVPDLASAAKVVNPTTIDITVRPGLTYSNGTPLDAAAVKAGFERNLANPHPGVWDQSMSDITSFDVTGTDTLVLNFSQPVASTFYPLLADQESFMAIPTGSTSANPNLNVVGAGPFMLKNYTQDQSIELVKNPKYWDAKDIHLAGITFTEVPNGPQQLTALESGHVDVEGIPVSDIPALKAQSNLQSNSLFSDASYFFVPICKASGPLANVKVRQALSYATDRVSINNALLFGKGEPAWTIFPSSSSFYDKSLTNDYAYNLKKAKALLTQAGYPHGFSTSIIALPEAVTDQLTTVLQGEWKKIGVDLKIIQSSNYVTDVYTLHKAELGLNPEGLPGIGKITTNYTPGDVGDICNYNNPTLNALTAQIQATPPGSPKLKVLWTKAQDFIMKNALSVYVDYQPIVTGAQKNVTGVQNIPYVGGVLNYWGVSVPA